MRQAWLRAVDTPLAVACSPKHCLGVCSGAGGCAGVCSGAGCAGAISTPMLPCMASCTAHAHGGKEPTSKGGRVHRPSITQGMYKRATWSHGKRMHMHTKVHTQTDTRTQQQVHCARRRGAPCRAPAAGAASAPLAPRFARHTARMRPRSRAQGQSCGHAGCPQGCGQGGQIARTVCGGEGERPRRPLPSCPLLRQHQWWPIR